MIFPKQFADSGQFGSQTQSNSDGVEEIHFQDFFDLFAVKRMGGSDTLVVAYRQNTVADSVPADLRPIHVPKLPLLMNWIVGKQMGF
jgi:hypothetical protein